MWGMRDGIRNSEYIWEMCVSSEQAIGRARVNLGICGRTLNVAVVAIPHLHRIPTVCHPWLDSAV